MLISLQYLRGVTALMVVYFHIVLQIEGLSGGRSILPAIGTSGVDVFFVLSGFVIWTTTLAHDRNPWHFYRRRLVRVAPLYWGATATAAAAALLVPHLMASTQFDATHFLASLFFIPWPNPSYPPPSGNYLTPLVVPGWTLNYEMVFYLLFGLVLPFRPLLRGLLLAALFAALLIAPSLVANPPESFAFYAFSYLIEFLLGAAIAELAMRKALPRPSTSAFLFAAGVIMLLAFDLMHVDRASTPVFPLAATLIVYAAVGLDHRGAVPMIPWFALLGAASYSIYLTNVFVLAALRIMWKALALPMTSMGQIMFLVVGLAVSAAVGTLVHLIYEKPAARMTKRLLGA